ncbi:MAG: hypothetical protein J3K34DRAFT_410493 [Monoraphidium minutum]|nr:MAG: hypothetical protein J3K34DRAFT_410493 [Monoraphidium minutum]
MATLASLFYQDFCCGSGAPWAAASGGAAAPPSTKRPRTSQRGFTSHVELVLSLEELFTGCTKRLALGAAAPPVAVPIAPGLRAGTVITLSTLTPAAPPPLPLPPGGVTITVREALHSTYRRVGDDLLAIAAVPLVDALTGGRLRLRRLDGRPFEFELPQDAVAQPGQVLSFKGEGMPCAADPARRGNLHVRLRVEFPSSLERLTGAQRAALRQALSA